MIFKLPLSDSLPGGSEYLPASRCPLGSVPLLVGGVEGMIAAPASPGPGRGRPEAGGTGNSNGSRARHSGWEIGAGGP